MSLNVFLARKQMTDLITPSDDRNVSFSHKLINHGMFFGALQFLAESLVRCLSAFSILVRNVPQDTHVCEHNTHTYIIDNGTHILKVTIKDHSLHLKEELKKRHKSEVYVPLIEKALSLSPSK